MHRQRLEHARKVIEELRDRDATYVGADFKVLSMSTWGSERRCGTVACLAGYFTLDPVFRAAGLQNSHDQDGDTAYFPRFEGEGGMEALMAFFGLTEDQAEHIFGYNNTNRWDDGIERIDDVLEGKDSEDLKTSRFVQSFRQRERNR